MKKLALLMFICALAQPAAAQFGGMMDSLKKAVEKNPATSAEQPTEAAESAEPLEAPFSIVPNMVWEIWDDEQKNAFYAELREAALKVEEEEAGKPLGFLKKLPLEGTSQSSPNAELLALAKWEDEAIAGYMAKDIMDRQRYMLAVEQEMLVVAFRGALKDVSTGQVKVLRAFNMNDEAAALEADANLLAGACDTVCLESVVKQSKEANDAIKTLTKNKADLSDEGKAQYSDALSDFGTGTLNMVLVHPLAKEWGPRAIEAVKAEVAGGLSAGMAGISSGISAGLGSALAGGATPAAEGAEGAEGEVIASNEATDQVEEAVEATAENMSDLLAPGIMVIKNGMPLLKDYVGLFSMLTKYGKNSGVDTRAAEDFDFGDF